MRLIDFLNQLSKDRKEKERFKKLLRNPTSKTNKTKIPNALWWDSSLRRKLLKKNFLRRKTRKKSQSSTSSRSRSSTSSRSRSSTRSRSRSRSRSSRSRRKTRKRKWVRVKGKRKRFRLKPSN